MCFEAVVEIAFRTLRSTKGSLLGETSNLLLSVIHTVQGSTAVALMIEPVNFDRLLAVSAAIGLPLLPSWFDSSTDLSREVTVLASIAVV